MAAWSNWSWLNRSQNGQQTPQQVEEPDPSAAPAVLTQGELDLLRAQVTSLEQQVTRMQYVESRSVKRLFLLARNVAKVLKANNVTPGEPVGNDAVSFVLSNDAGKWLEMVVYPFLEMFVLRDTAGVLNDVTFRFGNDERGDLPRETILMLNGFAEFASRNAADDSDAYWAATVNGELALTRDPAAV